MLTLQQMIVKLQDFWAQQGCSLHQGHDVEVGAGTFNPATFLRCLGPEPYRAAYVEPSRRPKDGRYGDNPNRMQLHHQFNVMLKPSPYNVQQTYLRSLEAIGFQLNQHDIRFVHDDWEQPTLGAWGLGWEVWRDGMEVTQFTYFQAVGGVELKPITVELTYGLERLAMVVQHVDSVWDLQWNDSLTYRDVFHRNEFEWSLYNFEKADTNLWLSHFENYAKEAKRLLDEELILPAYDFVMKASHAFNILDARGVISVTERTSYIVRIRDLSRRVAEGYIQLRTKLGTPLLNNPWPSYKRPTIKPEKSPSSRFTLKESEDFVLEIGSEELPATFIPLACQSLKQLMTKLLDEEQLSYEEICVYGAPRRLAVFVKKLAMGRSAQSQERRGPPIASAFTSSGDPTAIGEGFFRSLGHPPLSLASILAKESSQLEVKTLKETPYLFATVTTQAKATWQILSERLPSLILAIDFPKRMHWADLDITYARPLQWIVALHGKEVIPFCLGDLISGRTSSAHAQLCPGPIPLSCATTYLEELRQHKVMVDIEERKASILSQLETIEKQLGSKALSIHRVLPQVIHLTEWPQLTTASFNPAFLSAPPEVLICEMVEHQKYFPLADPTQQLTNHFVITADNTPNEEIRRGNIKVLSARLSDGVFLYEQDLKVSLDAFNEKLKLVIFRKELGSVYEKALRVRKNVELLYQYLPLGDLATAQRAALLCKADLACLLVGEFPELQGIVGRHYALAHGESFAVAQAIDEHWMPRNEADRLPSSPAGILVSFADKIDNLLSCFALNLKPTSSSDPYALRRQVLAIIKSLVHHQHHLPLHAVLTTCYEEFVKTTALSATKTVPSEIEAFFLNRIKTVFQDFGFTKDEIECSLCAGFSDIYDSFLRLQALHNFRLNSPQFSSLVEVYKRAKGLLAQGKEAIFSQAKLKESAEKQLAATLFAIEDQFQRQLSDRSYDQAFALIAQLQPPLAAFFDQVRVLDPDPALQQNRQALLYRVFSLFGQLLDLSKLQM